MERLRLGPELELPVDVLTSTVGILGIRGSGKTNTAGVIVEEATRVGIPSSVADPTGAWWGIKSSLDGKSAGLPFYVFGGEHADVPLEPDAGEIMARFAVDKRVPMILDLSLMTKGRQLHFMAAYAAELYHKNREALLQVIDETARFCPQTIRGMNPDAAKCLGAVEDLGALGRVRGLGLIIIGQRAAKINKDVLTQCHTLIVHQTNSPQDKKAVDDWIGEQYGTGPERDRFLRELPHLKRGEAFVWSPTFDVFMRAQIRARHTFDSSKTPEIGKRVIAPTVFASVDLDALTEELAASKQRADENDPAKLKARIRELEDEIRNIVPVERVVEVPTVPLEHIGYLEEMAEALDKAAEQLRALANTKAPPRPNVYDNVYDSVELTREPPRERIQSRASADGELPKAERALLRVIVQFKRVDKAQLGILSGYSVNSSSFSNAIGRLRSLGYAHIGWPIEATHAGREVIGAVPSLPTGKALQDYWIAKLPKAEGALLATLIAAHPKSLDKNALGERAGYSVTSSSFSNALGKLRALKLAEGYGTTRAAAVLFE